MSAGGKRQGSGRPSVWNNKLTTAIRVPTILVDRLLEHARMLDTEGIQDNVQNQLDSVHNYKLTRIQELVDQYQSITKQTRDHTISNKLIKELQTILNEV